MSELVASGVRLRRGARQVLDGVDLELRDGEMLLLAGRNGAGKSTLLRLLLGIEPPADGEVRLDNRPIAAWSALDRARRIAFVPQGAECPFEFTGRELVAMGRYPHRPGNSPLQADDLSAIDRALEAVDAAAFADRPVTTLSGGELRRIVVARALTTEAPLLLLDEPTANLDLEHALQLVGLLRREAGAGRGIVIATHDINLIAPHCDRAALLHGGRIVGEGRPEEVFSPERMREVFAVRATDPEGYFPRAFGL